jgi:hypothetical protein
LAVTGGWQGGTQEIEDIVTLLTRGGNHRQEPLDQATAPFRSGAIAQLAPDDPVTQGTLDGIVGRVNVGVTGKRPQHQLVAQQAPTGTCGRWVTQSGTDLQPAVNVALVLRHFRQEVRPAQVPPLDLAPAMQQIIGVDF